MVGRPFVPSFFVKALLTGPPTPVDASEEEKRPMFFNRLGDWIEDRKTGIRLLVIGAGFIALGVFIGALGISEKWEDEARTGIVALGTALTIAGVLTLTVDRELKDDIARNAFKKVMGWATPELLQSELEKVYEVPFFAVEHRMTIDLSEISSDGFTRMTFDTVRKIRNESWERKKYRPKISVREWQDPGRISEVTEISASLNGEPAYKGHELAKGDDDEATDLKWSQLTKEFTLAKKAELTVYYRGYEDKLPDDMLPEAFTYPTLNPRLIVNYPASFYVYVQFSSRGAKVRTRNSDLGSNRVSTQWDLEGTMLPNQIITIRWWPIPASQLETGSNER